MHHRFPMLAAGALGALSLLAIGCNETTRDDVTAARQNVQKEEKRLTEMKHDDARAIDEERREAEEARTTNKPIVGDDVNEGPAEERREVSQAESDAVNREVEQGGKVAEARAKLELTKDQLAMQVDRDKFVADARLHIDAANRAIEKLQANRDAADDAGKTAIDDRIKDLKHHRDFLETKIDDVEAAEVLRWTDHRDDVKKAMDELDSHVRKVE